MKRDSTFFRKILVGTITGVIAVVAGVTEVVAQPQDLDLAIIGGRVIDPKSGTDAVLNIGVGDGKIQFIGSEAIRAKRVIDAEGRVVSPGFIDMHAHGQTILSNRVQALDGVTTALELESGVWPVAAWYQRLGSEGRPINYGASVNWANARMAEFIGDPPADDPHWFENNFANPDWQNSISTPEQLQRISGRVSTGLEEGGLGIGFLLGYAPGAGRKEYFHMTELAAASNMPTYTHARFLSMLEPNSSFEAMAEIIAAAAGTGAHAHIVHMNSISLRDIGPISKMIANAQNAGVALSTEAYPYGAGATNIGAAMFRAENWRARVGNISAHNFDMNGARLSEKEFARLQEEAPGTSIVVHLLDTSVKEDQALLDQALLFPGGVIATDGGDWLKEGELLPQDTWPLPDDAWSHPRSAGTYARFIRHYVRDTQQLSLLQAVERVSYGPAKILQESVPQMRHKGRIEVGADADIVIFDLDEIDDRATYIKPASTSVGFDYVLVNGEILVDKGVLDTRAMPGLPVRNL
ncbi:amidohydrolase family protein [Microbulbifer bruguierae]|uniref:Amidohydrolase family protein n=1 Tax=Microbulbifer bruguierae TaxID=3029061 RepID=A0ABY8NG32_9GAMM|nr:amidohydrolase family protein [Microbulbifer bruguierae]WGL17886.1 amidohydrolase family protein [Microbulbifer bruguierae]